MDIEPCTEFKMESLESFEPLVNPIRQYRNRSKRTLKTGEEKLAEVLAKIASLQKSSEKTDGIDRTKVRTYNVKLRLKKSHLYKCFDCGNCFANPDFLELHEKSHAEQGKCDIDLRQEPVEAEMNLKQNAWFVGDFDDEDDDEEHIVQLDCTVEEGEDIFDITFDRTKCEKTYTMKYKVKKEPVGKCEHCAKQFYSAECWKLHELEHEKFLDIANVEPSINIIRSPKIEETTMTLDDSFYEGLSVSDILEQASGTIDCTTDGRLAAGAGITLEYRIIPRRSFSVDKGVDQAKDHCGVKRSASVGKTEGIIAAKIVNQIVCQPTVQVKEEMIIKEELLEEPAMMPEMISVKNEIMTEDEEDFAEPMAKQIRLENGYQCAACAKRFRFRAALQVHERTHNGTFPYRCSECVKAFVSKGKLFMHFYAQHRNKNRRLSCCKCEGSFFSPLQLLRHFAICEPCDKRQSNSAR